MINVESCLLPVWSWHYDQSSARKRRLPSDGLLLQAPSSSLGSQTWACSELCKGVHEAQHCTRLGLLSLHISLTALHQTSPFWANQSFCFLNLVRLSPILQLVLQMKMSRTETLYIHSWACISTGCFDCSTPDLFLIGNAISLSSSLRSVMTRQIPVSGLHSKGSIIWSYKLRPFSNSKPYKKNPKT